MHVHLLFGSLHGLIALFAAFGGLLGTVAVSESTPASGDAGAEPPADPDPSGDVDPGLDAGPGDEAGGAIDDDDDDEDADLPQDIRDSPTRLRTRLRRLQRQMKQIRPVADRLRGPDGKFVDVESLVHRARSFDEIDQTMRANPELRDRLLGRTSDDGKRAAEQPPAFDPNTLPFETDSEQGQFFAKQAQTIHELTQTVQRLEQRLGAVDQRDSQQQLARTEETWKAATLAASKQIQDPRARQFFIEAVYGRFHGARLAGDLATLNPQQVIDQMLGKTGGAPGDDKRRASAAAAQRIAERNKTLPRATRPGVGPGGGDKKPASVKDAKSGFLGKYAG